jgi:protein SCO1
LRDLAVFAVWRVIKMSPATERAPAKTAKPRCIDFKNAMEVKMKSLINRTHMLCGISSFLLILVFGHSGSGAEPVLGSQRGIAAQTEESTDQHEHHQEKRTETPKKQKEPSFITVPAIEILDQNGKKLDFNSDLIRGKIVVLGFMFTSCTAFCPLQGTAFRNLQEALGQRAGTEVILLSVSIEPETDSPKRLREWGAKFGVKRGWTLITGNRPDINKIGMAFTGTPAMKDGHYSAIFIGDNEKGIWIRTAVDPNPREYLRIIQEITDAPLVKK